MDQLSSIRSAVRTRIVTMFLCESDAESLKDDTDLLYVLDSLQLLRFVMELEAMYEVRISDSDLTLDNLGSVSKMAVFIQRLRSESADCQVAVVAQAA
jgi:acyl carrier protein